jgi:hypothetical protein
VTTELELAQKGLKQLHGATRHAARLIQWQLICKSFAYFLFAYVRTRDEHDATIYAKEIPRKSYIGVLAQALQLTRRLAVPKSRQLMVTWVCAAFVLWVALTRDHALCFVQSKKEEDADGILGRMFDIYVRLPPWLKEQNPINPAKSGDRQFCHMYFPWTRERIAAAAKARGEEPDFMLEKTMRSHIWGIPQGADVLRSYTATLIFSDEDAFQEEAGEAYTACSPTLAADSWFIKVSTANPGHFEAVVFDQPLDRE